MEFQIVHEFVADPAEVATALLDLEYQASLRTLGPLKERAVIDQTNGSDGRITRRIRCVLDIELPGPARAFIGEGDPAWVEEATWEPDTLSWKWVILPEVGGGLLSASGETHLKEGSVGTIRNISGSVRVVVPFYGGKVEGWIVDGFERAYDEEAQRLAAWLQSA
ncbi:MAG TPA: DUF2505 domain-containing protein [Actinomycetota bacterium]|nr:DUF2505 domain-containing protein [Actinomycetota bacterium]